MPKTISLFLALLLLLAQPVFAEAPKRKVDQDWMAKNEAITQLITQKKFRKAIGQSESLVADLKKKGMAETYEASTTLNNLGIAYMFNQELENAHAAFVKAAAIRIKALGKDDPETAAIWLNLADLHILMARLYRSEYDRIEKVYKGKNGAGSGKK